MGRSFAPDAIPTSAMDVNPLLKDDQNPGY